MSKFCTKCGRALQEGEICSCQTATGNQSVQQSIQPSVQPEEQQPQRAEQQQFSGKEAQNQQSPQPIQQQFIGQAGQQYSGQAGQQFNGQAGQQFNGQAGQQYNGQAGQQFNGQAGQQFNGQAGQQYNGQAGQQFGEQASAFAQNFLSRVFNLVKKPVTAGRELIVEADIKVALLLVVFQGIFSGLFALAVAGKFSQYIKAASGLANSYYSGFGNAMAGVLSMPYFRIFIVTLVFSVVLAVVLAGLLMLGHLIMSIPASFKQMLSTAAIRSAVLVPAILLSIVIFELSVGYGIALFILINIWGFAAMIVAMSSFIEKEKLNIFVLVISIIILLFIIIAIVAFSKLWTLYLPDLMRSGLDSLSNLSMQDILSQIMGNY